MCKCKDIFILKRVNYQTLFFNHQSLDLTLLDLSKSEPTVFSRQAHGAASSLVFEAHSLTNSKGGKSSGILWEICPWDLPREIFNRPGVAGAVL